MAYDICRHSLVDTLNHPQPSSTLFAMCCDGCGSADGSIFGTWHNAPLAETLHQLKTVCQFMATEGNSVS